MKKCLATLFALFLVTGAAISQDAPPPGAAPDWFLNEIATLTAGSGRWISDNSEYQNEQEPYDSYATEWESSFEGTTMTGRLFGILDGKESVNFWEFRAYWHPEKKHAVMEQFGWGGTVGIGTMWPEGDGTKSDQTFYAVDGSANRNGHISHFPDANTHVTASFDIVGDEWQPRRTYTWQREGS